MKKDPFYKREAKKYAKPIPSREYILEYLEKLGEPATRDHLVRAFKLQSEEEQEALRRRLIAMARDGQLLANRKGGFALVDKMSLVRGLVEGHKEGYGFVISEDGPEDIFLPSHQMSKVFHGDRVLVQVTSGRKRSEGVIVEILERNTKELVGRYFEENNVRFVVPMNKNICQDVLIPKGERKGAKHGQLVALEILSYPSARRQPTGTITTILGEHMAPGMEIEVAIRANGLPNTWSTAVKKEVKTYRSLTEKDCRGRKDLRKLPFVTIDGEDAKDFDDAVYCEKREKGGWRLFVAIADVGHYVKPGSALDGEALARGNSVYFPGQVVPMLPEVLSNEYCSLKPNEDRLVMVCDITISDEGKITRSKFYEAVICSAARLTYTEVGAMLEGGKKRTPRLLPFILELHALYLTLKKQRESRGAIEFETTETRIVFGEGKKIKKILPLERNDAHRLIEECMLAANVCAARFLLGKKIPALYRVHEGPDAEKLTRLREFLSGFGLKLTGGDEPTPLDYATLLQHIENRPDKHVIQTMLLRSMRQAVYDSANAGHFGLAYDAYGHFTSPIRRYPDLITHRAIRHAIQGGDAEDFYYDKKTVHGFGEHCSMTERRADDAVNDAIEWLKCEYMLDKMGKRFEGVISGVCGFGVFVELDDIYVEGLVHITSLPNDYYAFNPKSHCLQGKRSGKRYCLGDRIKVRVARVDLDGREIDFEL